MFSSFLKSSPVFKLVPNFLFVRRREFFFKQRGVRNYLLIYFKQIILFTARGIFFLKEKTPKKTHVPDKPALRFEPHSHHNAAMSHARAITTQLSHQPQSYMTKCPYFNLFMCPHYLSKLFFPPRPLSYQLQRLHSHPLTLPNILHQICSKFSLLLPFFPLAFHRLIDGAILGSMLHAFMMMSFCRHLGRKKLGNYYTTLCNAFCIAKIHVILSFVIFIYVPNVSSGNDSFIVMRI